MVVPNGVLQWVSKTYPRPRVDIEWLDACCAWVISELGLDPQRDSDRLTTNVEAQLLQSDLADSTQHGTGLPRGVGALKDGRLSGPPVLVELAALTEIGHSAFSLSNVRQARVDRADLAGLAGGEDADPDADDEGPVPRYPRAMLRMDLTDGSTTVRAIEYRRLPGLVLGETPLGFKLLLKDVRIRNGIALLEPANTVLKGHQTEDRDANRDRDFLRSLRARLGKPLDDPADALQNNNPPPPPPPPPAPDDMRRSPFRELSEPPAPPPAPTATPTTTTSRADAKVPSSSATLVSPYFNDSTPAARPIAGRLAQPQAMDEDDEEAFFTGPLASSSSGGAEPAKPSSDYGDDDSMGLDEEALAQVEQAEKAALARASQPQPNQRTSSADPNAWLHTPRRALAQEPSVMIVSPPPGASSQRRPVRAQEPSVVIVDTQPAEVITIDDEVEDDKENMPVPTRRVRRRVRTQEETEDEIIDISED